MKCIKCKETYDDDFKFCPYCGEEKPEPKICPNCQLEPKIEFSFCPECGEKLINKKEYEEEPEKIEIEELKKKEQIKKEEELNKLKKERKKLKLENIVVSDKVLDYKSKTNFISKINENIITTENELELEIKLKQEEIMIMKLKLKNIVEREWAYPPSLKYRLNEMIENNQIITEKELDEEAKRRFRNYRNIY